MGGVFCKEACQTYQERIEKRGKHSSVPWYSDVEVDYNGCRKLARLPPPGQHPRLLFTKEEIPAIVARFTHSEFSGQLKLILDAARRSFLKEIDDPLSELDAGPGEDVLERKVVAMFFKKKEQQHVNIVAAYVYGMIFDDIELAQKAKKAALFYSRVILRSREIALQDQKDGVPVIEPYACWLDHRWDLGIGWLLGGAPFALMYDLVFNELSIEERNLMRKAIATSVTGRRGWGMGWPTRRVQSNWAAYHGDLLTMCAAIEGETGCDNEVFSLFSDLMVHYLDYAFYDSGHPVEDCYAINLGLREGSICALAMARRGHNIFNHPHYKKIWTNWFPHALEPHNSGKVYGGSSGNYFMYPTSLIIAKYMFPKDRTIDFVYRHYMCENGTKFSRILKLQSRLAALVFAIPALSSDLQELEQPENLNLPLTFVCRDRGKVVMRSSWKEDAMWLTVDARPDCFLIGHDICSRGAFVLNANGRAWGFCPEWNVFKESGDYSLPSIDNIGQCDKAPFVKLQEVRQDSDVSTYVSADLTYAYNWTWTKWAHAGDDHSSSGYESEPHDPRSFGFNAWWAPSKLHGERDVGFRGLHQWRKRFAIVQKVFRSCLFVREGVPFIIIADDVKKDNDLHKYSWAMTTPDDVELLSYDNGDAVLRETGERGRRFLVRNLNHASLKLDCSFRKISKLRESKSTDGKVRQLVLECNSRGVEFRLLLCSLPSPRSKPPTTVWDKRAKVLQVRDEETNETHQIAFETHSIKACSISHL